LSFIVFSLIGGESSAPCFLRKALQQRSSIHASESVFKRLDDFNMVLAWQLFKQIALSVA
jgi:hypothetical protein